MAGIVRPPVRSPLFGAQGKPLLSPELMDLVELNEGRRSRVYADTEGIPTVGVGHNLNRPDSRVMLGEVGADYDAVRSGAARLTRAQEDAIFRRDLTRAQTDARRLVPRFDNLPDSWQTVLTDMSFNLGQTRLAGFEKFLGALNQKKPDFQRAVAEMKDSKWYRQVGNRSKRLVTMVGGAV